MVTNNRIGGMTAWPFPKVVTKLHSQPMTTMVACEGRLDPRFRGGDDPAYGRVIPAHAGIQRSRFSPLLRGQAPDDARGQARE